jgi:hypothetical protein
MLDRRTVIRRRILRFNAGMLTNSQDLKAAHCKQIGQRLCDTRPRIPNVVADIHDPAARS